MHQSSQQSTQQSTQQQTNTPNTIEATTTWKAALPHLLKTCRLSNIPGAIFMALVGNYHVSSYYHALSHPPPLPPISLKSWFQTQVLTLTTLNVMICIGLVTATSMVVNDYFDARSGTDKVNISSPLPSTLSKPLADGTVPLPYAKKFVSILYSTLLLLNCLLPQTSTRLAIVGSTILTFLYTNQIKPFTFWKNISCSFVIACTPCIGGLSSSLPQTLFPPTLLPIFLSVFLGINHRELLMDVQDVPGDRSSGVRTVPVVYGVKRGVDAAIVSAGGMMGVVGWNALYGGKGGIKRFVGLVGAVVMFLRAGVVGLKVRKSKGSNLEGIPKIYNWSLDPATGGVKGLVYGSTLFSDGSGVETSRLKEDSGSVGDDKTVTTESGSVYLLKGGEYVEGEEEGEETVDDEVFKAADKAINEGKITMFMVLLGLS